MDEPSDADKYLDRMAAALDTGRADVKELVVDSLMDAHSDNRNDADPDTGEGGAASVATRTLTYKEGRG